MRETRTSGSTRGEAIVPRHRYLSYSTATQTGEDIRLCHLSWNEAGMCPGINGFTKCAPIADWGWRTRGSVLPRVRQRGRSRRLAHIAKGAMYAPPQPGGVLLCQRIGNEAGMCPGINGFTKCAPIADLGVAHRWPVCRHVCVRGSVAATRTNAPPPAGKMLVSAN